MDVGAAHLEPFGHLGYAAAVFGLSQPVDDRPFEVAHLDRFLFRHPNFRVAEILSGLQENKSELGSANLLV